MTDPSMHATEHRPPHRAWIVLTAVALWGCGHGDTTIHLDLPGIATTCFASTRDATDILPANDGTVWVAGPGGLLLFDERGRLLNHLDRSDGLASNRVSRLLLDREGSLWVATSRGLSRFRDGSVDNFTRSEGLNSDQVLSLAEDVEGRLFVGTRRGVSLFDGDAFVPFDDTHEFGRRPTYDVHPGPDGRVLFAKENALTVFDGRGGWRVYQRDPLIPGPFSDLPGNSLLQAAIDREGRMWVGTTVGLGYLDDGGWQHLYFRDRFFDGDGPRDNRIESLSVDTEDGGIWLAHGDARGFDGGRGVSRFVDGRWSHWSAEEGLPDARVHRVRADGRGGAWVAGRGGGARIGGETVTRYRHAGDLPGNHVLRIVPLGDGLTAVLTTRGLAWLRNRSMVELASPPWIPEEMCLAGDELLATGDGRWAVFRDATWVPGEDLGGEVRALACADGEATLLLDDGWRIGVADDWRTVRSPFALQIDRPILRGSDDRVFGVGIGSDDALVEWAEGVDRRRVRLLNGSRVFDVAVQEDDTLWLATPDGLRTVDEGRRHRPPGLPRFAPRVLTLDGEDRLWIGTRAEGVWMWDGANWHELRVAGSSLPAEITALVFDTEDTLWIGSAGEGAMRLDLGRAGS